MPPQKRRKGRAYTLHAPEASSRCRPSPLSLPAATLTDRQASASDITDSWHLPQASRLGIRL